MGEKTTTGGIRDPRSTPPPRAAGTPPPCDERHLGPTWQRRNGTYGIDIDVPIPAAPPPSDEPKDAPIVADAIRLLDHHRSLADDRPFYLQVSFGGGDF